MFLRRNRKVVDGEAYDYWTLCESTRTAQGPRQRVVASLGKLDSQETSHGWEDIDALLEGHSRPRQLQFGQSDPPEQQVELVDIHGVRVERSREFGSVYLGLALWRRLGLHTLLGELIESGRESVPWEAVASILSIGRFCAQTSELSIAQEWYERTALEDLLAIDPMQINDDRLYRGLDVLIKHRDKLCGHLMERYKDWFGVNMEFLIYDVTSTFFEGQCERNPNAARGYSRDNRSDCKQVCIGLVCSAEGLPLSYEVFKGNRSDVTTVESIVRQMEDKYGKAQRIWVMDRGMVSEKNIEFLRQRGARYIVGTPKSQLRHFEAELLSGQDWREVNEGVEARLVEHPDGNGAEKYVLCRSSARRMKEAAMLERQTQALAEKLAAMDRGLRRSPQNDVEKVGRRIGRYLGKYPAAARVIEAVVIREEQGAICGLNYWSRVETGKRAGMAQGAYLLRTNCTEEDPAKIWQWYMQLTQAEAAFRTAKSDIGLRPIFHQLADRVESHILVCFLSLAM